MHHSEIFFGYFQQGLGEANISYTYELGRSEENMRRIHGHLHILRSEC